ncbi:RNA pyrophosphohydrolase [Reyranella sp.]|jgi:putative (di)nucleoside polyphosphate hydrolase|uniref:RNA pyrophosphohydrolase n=1 Tax=Reyranella sp. TaxID=1929291 RepID=UPI0025E63CC1|nr:RNA pyrophosphohydrolase [Reyranella sp.]
MTPSKMTSARSSDGHAGYRPNVGLMLIAPDRRVFVGCRVNQPDAWQMPQGGIDRGESTIEAACRELYEEIGTTKALVLRESAKWISYDVPEERRPPYWKGRWHGQAQKWFALAFTGCDADIDIHAHDKEFESWRWIRAGELADLIVPFKRPVYDAVFEEFSDLIS